MALDLVATVRTIAADENIDLNVRIGIAAGPMTAGIIGKNKFSYDVWGDPVNMASRLEQSSEVGRITICPTCYAALKESFILRPRGLIDIKGVGEQEAWFLDGRREPSLTLPV